jgi:peptidoglycan/LPS O-acetylase OafA/YrhL
MNYGDYNFDIALWTMPIEIWGSVYVFVLALVATRMRHPTLFIIFIICIHSYYIVPINPYRYYRYLCFPIGTGCAFFIAKFDASNLISKILKMMYPLRELAGPYLFFEGYRIGHDMNYTP